MVVGIFHLQQTRVGLYKKILTLSERVVVQHNDRLAVMPDGDNPIPYDTLSKESGCEIYEYAYKRKLMKNQYIETKYVFENEVIFFPCLTFSIRIVLLDNG